MDFRTLLEKREEYRKVCALLEEAEREAQQNRERIEQSCREKFALIKQDSRTVAARLLPIVAGLKQVGGLTVAGGRLYFYGRPPIPLPFDEKDCFEVYKAAKNTLKNVLPLMSGNPRQAAKPLAEAYATLIAIGERTDELRDKSIEAALREEEERLRKLKERRDKLASADPEASVREAFEQASKKVDAFLFNNDTELCDTLGTSPHIPIGAEFGEAEGCRILSSVKEWELEKDGILRVLIHESDLGSDAVIGFVENVILRFVCAFPDLSRNILVCNGSRIANRRLISFCGKLNFKSQYGSIFYNRDGSKEVETSISEDVLFSLSEEINSRFQLLYGYRNVLEYNACHKDNVQPIILAVLYGVSSADYSKKYFENIIKQGSAAGIYLLLVENEDARSTGRYGEEPVDVGEATNNLYTFSRIGQEGFLVRDDAKYSSDLFRDDFDLESFVERLRSAFDEGAERRIIPFEDVVGTNVRTHGFTEQLSIPVGKSGDSVFTLDIDVFGKSHVVFAGTTGTGKSSLLRNIVLGTAYHYSPDEVELWLLDFKDGASFALFDKLKHVKMMALKNKAEDTDEIIGYIMAEKNRRGQRIKEESCNDIVGYNAAMLCQGKPLMPRLLICIDEYTAMRSKKGSVDLVEIANQGRSYGMHLVMCSQQAGDFRDITKQAVLRFEFANTRYEFIPFDTMRGVSGSAENCFLHMQKGNCIFTSDGITLTRLRIAYAGKEGQQMELISAINEKYPDFPAASPVIMNKIEQCVLDPLSPPEAWDADRVRAAYAQSVKDGHPALYVPIGKTRLSHEQRYLIDHKNPILFLFGDERRAASVEYSITRYASRISDGETNVYYVDLGLSGRKENCMQAWKKRGSMAVEFLTGAAGLGEALAAIHKEYLARKQDDGGEYKPIELIMHCAERISVALGEASVPLKHTSLPTLFSLKEGSPSFDTVEEGEALLAARLDARPNNKREKDESAPSVRSIFRELYERGRDHKIFMVMQFDFDDAQDFAELFPGDLVKPNLKDVVVLPPIPDGETASSELLDKYLVAARQMQRGDRAPCELERYEFIPSVLIDEKNPTKIIIYEWEEK